VILFISSAHAHADDLRSAVQNPISFLISLPFKFTIDEGAPNGSAGPCQRAAASVVCLRSESGDQLKIVSYVR